jgi:hypothetical protein
LRRRTDRSWLIVPGLCCNSRASCVVVMGVSSRCKMIARGTADQRCEIADRLLRVEHSFPHPRNPSGGVGEVHLVMRPLVGDYQVGPDEHRWHECDLRAVVNDVGMVRLVNLQDAVLQGDLRVQVSEQCEQPPVSTRAPRKDTSASTTVRIRGQYGSIAACQYCQIASASRRGPDSPPPSGNKSRSLAGIERPLQQSSRSRRNRPGEVRASSFSCCSIVVPGSLDQANRNSGADGPAGATAISKFQINPSELIPHLTQPGMTTKSALRWPRTRRLAAASASGE